LPKEVIRNAIFGDGHFLGSDQALSVMQSEYIYPQVGDRLNPNDWEDAGSLDAKARAQEIVKQALATHLPTHIYHEIDSKIRQNFDIKIPIESMRA